MIRDIFESVVKYLIWALSTYFLAKFFGKMFLYFLAFIKSGIFSTPMQLLLGVAGGLLAIVMMTVGALGIAGIVSKLICVHLLKFESLKNDSFAIPDFEEIFKTNSVDKKAEHNKKSTFDEMIDDIRKTEKIDSMIDEYYRLENKINSLKEKERRLPVNGLFNTLDVETWKKVGQKRSNLEREIFDLEFKQQELKSKIHELGGLV